MYKKGVAVEIQFSAARMIAHPADQSADPAADPAEGKAAAPYSIALNTDEARSVFEQLKIRLNAPATAAPIVLSLDDVLPAVKAFDPLRAASSPVLSEAAINGFKQWVCVICGWVYDEETGLPDEGIAPGTRFEAIPDDWRCPLCDVGKEDFVVVEF